MIVANEQGSLTTPSFVSFTDDERLIGESAKNQAAMNPANTSKGVQWMQSGVDGADDVLQFSISSTIQVYTRSGRFRGLMDP